MATMLFYKSISQTRMYLETIDQDSGGGRPDTALVASSKSSKCVGVLGDS